MNEFSESKKELDVKAIALASLASAECGFLVDVAVIYVLQQDDSKTLLYCSSTLNRDACLHVIQGFAAHEIAAGLKRGH